MRKKTAKKRLKHKNKPPGDSSEGLTGWEKKRNNMLNISTLNISSDRIICEFSWSSSQHIHKSWEISMYTIHYEK